MPEEGPGSPSWAFSSVAVVPSLDRAMFLLKPPPISSTWGEKSAATKEETAGIGGYDKVWAGREEDRQGHVYPTRSGLAKVTGLAKLYPRPYEDMRLV